MSRATLLNRIIEEGYWEDFLSFAAFMRYEKNYSIFTSALIYLQRPGALYVDTETGWNKRERYIGPGVTPIVVVHPFGPVNFVYEYSDTYGKPIPQYIRETFRDYYAEPPAIQLTKEMLPYMKSFLSHMGIHYEEALLGSRLYGEAQFLNTPYVYKDGEGKNAREIKTRYASLIRKSLSDTDKVFTIFHEIGHILCGHLPQDTKNTVLKVPKRDEHLSVGQKEFEAEKTCELFSRMCGLEYNPAPYLEQYSGDFEEADYSLRYIAEAVDKMLALW